MSEDALPRLDFDEVADLILQIGSHTSPAELHGFIAGQLAAGGRSDGPVLLSAFKEMLDVQSDFSHEEGEKLRFIYMSTLNALMDPELGFYPLLADDDSEIDIRLTTLSQWCQNFLSGFATVEKAISDISEIVNDALNDMAAISQVGVEADEVDEDMDAVESDYTQLVEYIRLATMNIFMEYLPEPAKDAKATAADTAQVASGEQVEQTYLNTQDLFQQRKIH